MTSSCYISVFFFYIQTSDQRHYKRRGAAVFEDTEQRPAVIGENICIDGRRQNAARCVPCFIDGCFIGEFSWLLSLHCVRWNVAKCCCYF